MDLESLKHLRKHLKVAHHVPGRIRIKFGSAPLDQLRAVDFSNQEKTIPGIKSIRVKMGARSVIIEYDADTLSPELLQEVFTTREANRFKEIIEGFAERANP
jgi:hypothetical protein